MALADRSFTFTELLRDPKPVAEAAASGRVRIRRRGAADLVLGPADADEEANAQTAAVTRFLAVLTASLDASAVSGALSRSDFAWTEWLPPHQRLEFVADLLRSVSDAAALESYRPINQTVREWSATAAIYADPELAERLRRPIRKSLDRPVAPPA